MKIMLIGPLPPPIGGSFILFQMLVEEFKRNNISHVSLNSHPSKSGVLCKIKTTFHLALKILGQNDCDIIILNGSTPSLFYLALPIALAASLQRKPLILRAFGGSLPEQYESRGFIFKILVQFSLIKHTTLLETHRMVHFFKEEIPKSRISWFPNSRPSRSQKTTRKLNSDKLKLIFLSQVRPEKGIIELIESINKVNNPNVTLDIYGPVSSDIDIGILSNGDSIKYMGTCAASDAPSVIENYDALVLPTYYSGEGHPGAILEAYTSGTPVIASDWKDIKEIVIDQHSGLLIKPKCVKSLASAIEMLHKEKGLLERLSSGAYEQSLNYSSKRWNLHNIIEVVNGELEPKQ